MKVCTKKTAPKFNPIELTISIESEQELDLLKWKYCLGELFNLLESLFSNRTEPKYDPNKLS